MLKPYPQDGEVLLEDTTKRKPKTMTSSFEQNLENKMNSQSTETPYYKKKLFERQNSVMNDSDSTSNHPISLLQTRTPNEILDILRQDPELLNSTDSQGMTMIHHATIKGDLLFLSSLADLAESNSWLLKDSKGRTPLQVGIDEFALTSTLRFVIVQCPQATMIETATGHIPLVDAMVNQRPGRIVQMLVAFAGRDELLWKDPGTDRTPIYFSIKYGKYEFVSRMLKAAPELATAELLHFALWQKSNRKIIDCIKMTNPYSVTTQVNGEYALHVAIRSASPLKTISDILNVYPRAPSQADDDGNLPLHYGLDHKASHQVVSQLLEYYPEGCSVLNDAGDAPIHKAITNSQISLTTILSMIDKYPESLECIDKDGNNPLYLLCERNVSADTIYGIIRKAPLFI